MEKQKRHISTLEKSLIIALIISVLAMTVLLYFYHTRWNGTFIVDEVPTSIVGVVIIFSTSTSIIATSALITVLVIMRFPTQSQAQKQVKKLSDTFEPIEFKDFDYFNLSDFTSIQNVKCMAKKDEEGKITIKIYVTHETDDPAVFEKFFKV